MVTACRELLELRRTSTLEINPHNQNRYRLLVNEAGGTTAYCFSTPIYTPEGTLVHRRFILQDKAFRFTGSNAEITVHNDLLVFQNAEGTALLRLPFRTWHLKNGYLYARGVELHPTFNGVAIRSSSNSVKFTVSTNKPFYSVRCNQKYFSIMQDKYKPFLTLSALTANSGPRVLPAEVRSSKSHPRNYEIEVFAKDKFGVSFEINLYEPKLFQDTTAESVHPDKTNTYGTIAFLGKTPQFGEQWLYIRPDFSRLPEFYSTHIKRTILHLPCLHASGLGIAAFSLAARFCSFGSTWNNRIPQKNYIAELNGNGRYLSVDLTDHFGCCPDGHWHHSDGIILKPRLIESGFSAISTGDSCSNPLILEVQYD